tara:strand:+ start:5946 stop:6917 length:972 start_codon:yes stop_codon:yes gene_type:complete
VKILITGVAGFIGFRLAERLLKDNHNIYGIDNLNNYYSKKLKVKRLQILKKYKFFKFKKLDLKNKNSLNYIKKFKNINVIYHFAAQAGVRFTLTNPQKYFDDNIKSFFNLIEVVKNNKNTKFFFASSSSVYGDQKKFPLSENIQLNEKNIYGLSKKINEIMCENYSRTFGLKMIGLRFFTVFGEWGRPDMLIFKYIKSNLDKKNFYLNSDGQHFRDFTYIDDVLIILKKLLHTKIKNNYEVFNICSNKPIKVLDVIKKINKWNSTFKFRSKNSKFLNKIEVFKTHGDNKKILKLFKKFKYTSFDKALNNTIKWYLDKKINKIT